MNFERKCYRLKVRVGPSIVTRTQFMSPDPEIQAPYSQGLNRFAGAFNSPLNYTDPPGFTSEETQDIGLGLGLGVAWAGGLVATLASTGGAHRT